jgi:uncharacterized membrane protein SpoIIM required for sporulation
MNAERFVRTHLTAWERLSALVDRAQKSHLAALSEEELHELGALYRRCAADLARARTRYAGTNAGRELVRSLNALVLRAHTQVYSAPTPQPLAGLQFALYGFPAAFRRHWRAIALAAVLLFLPAFLAFIAVVAHPDAATLFVPESAVREVEKRAQEGLTTGWGANTSYTDASASPEISSFIMVNNIRVATMALALGISAGIGTAVMLLGNGLMIGGLAGVASNERVDLLFWAVILPHGVLELTAIAIAGGAGFLLARAIYAPGTLPRRDALKLAGREAAQLIVGVAGLLVVAGLIEGFLTPLPLPPMLKLAFAALTAVALILYLRLRPKENENWRSVNEPGA